ncbi:MAG: HNH endonuclease, partial [Caulobacteraceae bacterium]
RPGSASQAVAKVYATALVQEHGINVAHQLYRKTGDWYHILADFPGALLDEHGYIRFNLKAEYDRFIDAGNSSGISQNIETKTLIVRGGISGRSGYTLYSESILLPDETPDLSSVVEGRRLRLTVNAYERDASARRRCILKWGSTCAVCDFNFGDVYGEIGTGFIHVHHLTPVSAVGESYELSPERDLRPVCPNCHAMIHTRTPPLTIEEMRAVIGGGLQKI